MTEASTKISNTWKGVFALMGASVVSGGIAWASWMTASQISLQTQLAKLAEKVDAAKEVKQSDDRRHELAEDKLERRLASIENKLDRALGLAGLAQTQQQNVYLVNDRLDAARTMVDRLGIEMARFQGVKHARLQH